MLLFIFFSMFERFLRREKVIFEKRGKFACRNLIGKFHCFALQSIIILIPLEITLDYNFIAMDYLLIAAEKR